MIFTEQEIKDVWVIEAEPIADSRGAFRRHFCQNEFRKIGLQVDIAQTNISENKNKHTLRGFHYQLAPHEEDKVLTCMQGALYDVIIDLRPSSETFLKWIPIQLKAEDNLSIYVPAGCANAYLTLKNSTTILYYMSEYYQPSSYTGFRYNDPLFSVEWPVEPDFISEKDKSFDDFDPSLIKTT
jgi:dTDP-4-dehydrorhamnose 3,5-epimerase